MTVPLFPGSVKTYTDKVDGVSVVQAADINSVQAEVSAVETALGTNPATSALPSAGSYNPNGVSTSVGARIANLEAGLTAGATDGSRVGWTQLATGNFTASTTISNISSTNYRRLVLVLECTTGNATPSAVLLTVNGGGQTYKFYHATYSGATVTNSATGTSWPISGGGNFSTGLSIVADILNPGSSISRKHINFLADNAFGHGSIASTDAITSMTITSAANYPTAATYTLFGVK